MTIGSRIAWDDTVLPFKLTAPDIRGRVARLDGVLDRVLEQHDYPPAIEALVAEMALLTALIGQTLKLRWKLSLQVRGDGPVRLIATDYYAPKQDGAPAQIRAYASYDDTRPLDGKPFDLIGKGYFAILIDQGTGTTPYQGITPIAGESLSQCAETCSRSPNRIPTRFALRFGHSTGIDHTGWRAGAVMLQAMPKGSIPAPAETTEEDARLLTADDILEGEEGENWQRANILLDTVEELELVGPSVQPTELLVRLFNEEQPRVFDAQPVEFGCTCSPDKVRQSLSIYSARDIGHMTTEEGTVTADCQFCGAHYVFDPKTLGFEAEEARVTKREALRSRLRGAIEAPGKPSSNYDLNKNITLPPNRKLRAAAVLLPIALEPRGIRLYLTKRSSRLKHHPGPVAFPGGKLDETDSGPEAAALREAQEEIGLDPANVEILGRLHSHETVTSFDVTPVIGLLHDSFEPMPEPGEVQEVFTVPLELVTDPSRFTIETRRWRGVSRSFYTVPHGPYYIWGATARILRSLADRIAP